MTETTIPPLTIGGIDTHPGDRIHIQLDIARLYDSTEMTLPVEIIRGHELGPILFLSGAVHGDEVNGTEIIRRILVHPALNDIRGTLLAVPIVNVYGFNTKSRYLPDRRDLNRSFPGSAVGSLTARLADVFLREIIHKSTHGIDLHTGAVNRSNLPQIRACLENPDVTRMAEWFGAPVILDEPLREGSLREYCDHLGVPTLLYEGGEALRFSEKAIQAGVRGVLGVMAGLGMIPETYKNDTPSVMMVAGSHWVRAPQSGILSTRKHIGDEVQEGESLGIMTDAFGHETHDIPSPIHGMIIGATTTPLLNQGDAAYHIAYYKQQEEQ